MLIEVAVTPPSGWDGFVAAHAQGTTYHRAVAVSIGERAFGLPVFFLTARAAERIVGVLPLVEQSSVLFGRFLVSVPFFNYGGALASDDDVALALAERAADLARERRVDHIELRQAAPIVGLDGPKRVDKVALVLNLPPSVEQLAERLGSKLRSQIRRAEREQPEVVWGGSELLSDFYGIFAKCMHKLGTPTYARVFFEVFLDALGDAATVLIVRAAGRVEAAAIVVRHAARLEVPWAVASPAAKRNALNMRMYWEMLLRAVAEGARAFDFGRSTVGSGTYRFKLQWGAQPQQLHWYYWLPDGKPVPMLNHSNPKYALAAAVWQRLPLWCANLVGPRIARHLP